MLRRLRPLFHEPDAPGYRTLEWSVYGLITASVVIFGLHLGLAPEHPLQEPLYQVDHVLTLAFLVEYSLRLLSYHPPTVDFYRPTRRRRLRHHVTGRLAFAVTPMMLIDLLTVLAVAPQLRGLRAVRLLRLLRAGRVLKVNNPFSSVLRAFAENRLLFAFGLSLVGTAVVVGGLSLYLAERDAPHAVVKGIDDGLWWALVTLTTVGYGDISPVTNLGRLIGTLLMVSGMFSLALFAGLVGHALLNAVVSIREEQYRMSQLVDHIVVCGYGPEARLLLDAMSQELGPQRAAFVLFGPGERPADVPPSFAWISGDPTRESELGKARLAHARAVLVVGDRSRLPQDADSHTLMILFTIRRFCGQRGLPRRQPLYLIAEILDPENVDHARAAGADEVIETARLGFDLLAHTLAAPGTGKILSAVASASAHSVFVGALPLGVAPGPFAAVATAVQAATGALVIGIRDREDRDHLAPPPEAPVSAADRLVYLARRPCLTPPTPER